MIQTTNNRHLRRISILQERRRRAEREQRERVARATGHSEGYSFARDEMTKQLAVPDEPGVKVVRLNEEPKQPILRVPIIPRPLYRAIDDGVVSLNESVRVVEYEAHAFAERLTDHQAIVWYAWKRR